jgi:hypothetical protein
MSVQANHVSVAPLGKRMMEVSGRMSAWSAAWGVVALVLGGGAVASWVAPRSGFPDWPAPVLSALTVGALYVCFACLIGIWPVGGRSKRQLLTAVDLVAEQVGNKLRLVLVNRGAAAEFLVQVTGILDPMRQQIPPQSWTVPWLEDRSVGPKRVLRGARQVLDFASYDFDAVNAEIGTAHAGACHWWFSTAGGPVGARYYHLHERNDLEVQRFTLTVRIMNASSGGYLDLGLSIGVRGDDLVCEIGTLASK